MYGRGLGYAFEAVPDAAELALIGSEIPDSKNWRGLGGREHCTNPDYQSLAR